MYELDISMLYFYIEQFQETVAHPNKGQKIPWFTVTSFNIKRKCRLIIFQVRQRKLYQFNKASQVL